MPRPFGKQVRLDSSEFSGVLSTADDDVQKALETVDQLDVAAPPRLTFVINGMGNVIPEESVADIIRIPGNATPVAWTLAADVEGDLVLDVRAADPGVQYPPAAGDSIINTGPPELSSAQYASGAIGAGEWDPVAEGEAVRIVVLTCETITRFTLVVELEWA